MVSAVDFLWQLEQDYLDSAKESGILLNTGIFVSGLKLHQLIYVTDLGSYTLTYLNCDEHLHPVQVCNIQSV